MLEGSELNRTPSLYNMNAWDTQAIFLKMEMCIARCKSWSPTNKVNCLFFITGIDRRILTTTHFSVRLSYRGFITSCLLVGHYSSSFLKRKSLNYQGLTQPGDTYLANSPVKMITRSPFSYVLLSRTGWHLPI